MSLAIPPSRPPLARQSSPLSLVRRAQVAASPGAALTPTTAAVLMVGADDDMATLHARLERVANRRVTLALTPGSRVPRSALHFRVLCRFAEELGLTLLIASDEPERRRTAHEFGFAVQRLPRTRRWRPRLSRVASALGAVCLLAAVTVGLPHTQVTLSPHAAPLTHEATLTVDLRAGAPGVAAGWAAGKTLATTFEIEHTIPTTGKEAIGHTPANGYVTFYDLRAYTPPPIVAAPPAPSMLPAVSAPAPTGRGGAPILPGAPEPAPVTIPVPEIRLPEPPPERVLPAGTALLTQDGQRFFTQSEVRLRPSAYATVPIVAEYPGRAGNVPAGVITRVEDGQPVDTQDLRLENRLPTRGGADRHEALVAPDDREALKQALEARAAAEAPARLFAEAGTNFLLVPDTTTWTLETHYDYAPGQRTAQLHGRAVVRAQAIGVPSRAAEELASRQWRERLPADLSHVGTPQIVGAPAVQEHTDQHLVIALPVQGQVIPRLDAASLAERLRGQPVEAVRRHVAGLPGLRDTPRVEVWPAWAPAALRVDVTVAAAR